MHFYFFLSFFVSDVAQDDFDMMSKPPIPDNESSVPFDYHPQQFFQQDNGGMVIHGSMMQGLHAPPAHMGSSMGVQARYDDFMSDDGQFV